MGNPAGLPDPLGHTTRYLYDPSPRGDLSRIIDLDKGEERVAYPEGLLQNQSTEGQAISYRHSSANVPRLRSISLASRPPP